MLAGLTSLAEFPWQKVEQLIAGKLAQIEAEVVRMQRQHQALSQCAELLALHPCRYGAPVPHDSESQLYQRDAGQAHEVA
ncbi:hypothetical protein D3C85_1176100 [compost metagenome]